MQDLLNSSNYEPIRDLRLFEELLAIHQVNPEIIGSIYKEFSDSFDEEDYIFGYKTMIDMIADRLPNYTGNLSGNMNIKGNIDGLALSDILRIILSNKINVDQAIANINVALGIPPKNRDLFGFVLYDGQFLPNEIVDRLKNGGMEFEYGIVGRYKKVVDSKSYRKLILEDQRLFDPSLKATFAVTWNIADSYNKDGSKERPFYVWTSKTILNRPFIIPPANELLAIEKGKTYKREFTIPK